MAATASRQSQHTDYTDPLRGTLIQRVAVRWELVILSVILLLAIFTRLYALGDRAMSHDESLHVYYSYELYMKGDFNHSPLMHGPILFHATALSFALFGDNDFSGRLYAAVLGIALVMTPVLFRRWLGRWGVILACAMLLISPLLMYYNRYIRHDTPSILSAILMIWAALMYINGPPDQQRKPRFLYVISAAMLWNLGSKETAFIYIALFGAFFTLYWLFRMGQAVWKIPARQWFSGTLMAIILGGTLAIAMYIIVDIIPLNTVATGAQTDGLLNNRDSRSFVVWSVLALVTVVFIAATTLLWAYRGRFKRVPWRELIILTVAIVLVTGSFVFIEERSHITREQIGVQAPLDPSATEAASTTVSTIRWLWVLAPWALMVGALALFVVSRRKNAEGKDWWDWLHQFPELDVLWVMGSLILPWATGVFIVSARGTPAEYESIGASFSFLRDILPVQSSMQVGQFVVGGLCWLPLMITAIAAGVTWNWRRFIVCWLIFHSLFAFFFTTVFTNIPGLATGMIYSLQYWLEQQAERRGSQPQYYYTLIILPMYEFLPIIGSVAASFAGTFIFWKRRRRIHDLEDELIANRKQLALAAVDGGKTSGEPDGDDAPAPVAVAVDAAAIEARSAGIDAQLAHLRRLDEAPFLLLVGFWAVLNIIIYTLAGEKMPWLGTHMTTPMIFLTAWFFGRIFDRIDWSLLRKAGWISLLIFPLGLAAVFQLVVLQLTGQGPFQGVTQFQLEWTYSWLAAAAVAIGVAWGYTYIRRLTSGQHVRQLVAVALFGVLAVVTFRSAWMASFINYDYPNEFLVYAHATNGTKEVMRAMEDISRRTTDGLRLKFAYDNKLSWPGAWYFRQYPNAVYMGESPTLQVMENATVVLVGDENRNVVEPLLEDRYQRFDFKRMWWPMQDYFYMTAERMIDLFDMTDSQSAQMRLGIWDIFWQRDYTRFGEATGHTYTFDRWPVAENQYMYVRKDVAAQVWPYGIGDGSVLNPIDSIEVSPCVANWQQYPALTVFDTTPLGGALDSPLGIDVTSDGRVFVAEVNSNRISEFTTDGAYVRSFGEQGPADRPGTFFERPHSVEVAADGSIVVVDTWNYQVRVFDHDLRQTARWGQALTVGINAPADPPDGFWGPREVAIGPSDGLIYIADTGNKRIRVYTPQGEWVRDIGRGGSGEGQIDEPTGIVVHPDGRVFIAETWNRRIGVFAADGTFITTYPVRAWYDDFGNRPYVALDVARDYLYVTDPDGGRVLVYSASDGACIGAFGRLNREFPNTAEFSTIGGIDTDAEGNVYVVDLAQGRVLKFPPFPTPESSSIEDPPGVGIPVDIPPDETAEVQG